MSKIITPVVTAFDKNGEVDLESNKKIIDFLIHHQVDGILVLGSTGEFPFLSKETKLALLAFYKNYVNKRVDLWAGTGAMDIDETIELSNKAFEMGYKGVYVISPYYFPLDQKKLFTYYDCVAKNVKGSVYLYNFPNMTKHSIDAETIVKLVESNKNIVGLKDSVTLPQHTLSVFSALKGKSFEIFSGFDDQFLLNLSLKGAGGIGGLSNIVPEIWVSLVQKAKEKDFVKLFKLAELITELTQIYSMDASPALIFKKLLNHRGLGINTFMKFPFNEISKETEKRAVQLLDEALVNYARIK